MRHNSAKPRVIYPDLFYQSELVAKLTNKVMKQGKKALAQKIVYQALHLVNKQTNRKPLEVLQEAYQNVTPKLELALRKVRSATYRIPTETTERRQQVLALRWLVTFARQRPERTMVERLAREIIDASKNTGRSIKKKEETYKMAESNRAFAYFRF